MRTSLLDIFKVGVGPSSSHTVGPMRAGRDFLDRLDRGSLLPSVDRLEAHLYGSLALTGRGHGTDGAVHLGLAGYSPDRLEGLQGPLAELRSGSSLSLPGGRAISFVAERDILFHPQESMPMHPNGLRLMAWTRDGALLLSRGYYSIGGGFVMGEGDPPPEPLPAVPHPFTCADELIGLGQERNLPIWRIGWENELAWHSAEEIEAWLSLIWEVMLACVSRGLDSQGLLPGGLEVPRRASLLARKLEASRDSDPLSVLDWVDAFAMAVSEENAAGGRVVTAPTNGAAGIIPAVAHYYWRFVPGATDQGLRRYFLTAAVLGTLYKENASISGADVGCQGEVGVASSMAAGGLVAALGGSNRRVEKAAEIGMEHNLGMTCDPVGGLVQIPCIERNAVGAVKAINACRLAMREGEDHKVSLDRVIRTMLQTGRDMRSTYKETSLGGLAVNVTFC